jgi:hypothetical protein
MNRAELRKTWNGLGENAVSGMLEWRLQHPEATFREIEQKWEVNGGVPVCPNCGLELEKKGKLQTRGGQEIELEREYGKCPG